MNLNKNQMKFFVAAINHYGEQAGDVRLKDLNSFAKENDLIIPTSALKNICTEEGLVRGHYNLLLTGIEPEIDEPEPETPFPENNNVIIDTPIFAQNPTPKTVVVPGKFVPESGQKPLNWKNPVYVVSENDGSVIGVHKTSKGAYEKRHMAFHDHGTMDLDDFEARMKYIGAAIIRSAHSQLTCLIEIKELDQ